MPLERRIVIRRMKCLQQLNSKFFTQSTRSPVQNVSAIWKERTALAQVHFVVFVSVFMFIDQYPLYTVCSLYWFFSTL